MMDDSLIIVNDVTKDYKNGKGNFNISFEVKEGEFFGLVGENGAGKTTLIRQLMGFIKSDEGYVEINGLDAYKNSAELKNYIGYVPGEINFPDLKTGSDFLKSQAKKIGIKDFSNADSLIKRLQLDVRAYPKRKSKGMKQKTALVTALMGDKPIIILDEPTTGLDPLMRDKFLNIMKEEKKRGRTLIMSSNTISELESICDKVMLISKGKNIAIADMNYIKNIDFETFKIEFNTFSDYEKFKKERKDIIRIQENFNQVTIKFKKNSLDELINELSNYNGKFINEIPYTLDTYFNEVQTKGASKNE